jgi:hypothetical protein
LIAKCDLQVAQRNMVSTPIYKAEQGPGYLGKAIAGPSRKQRD